ncbi:GAF domain-containing protein [bacterium]|nr:GAF domain-containing protein [bacterium]
MKDGDTSALLLDVRPEIPEKIIERWQNVANIAAKLIGVPSGLIMRVHTDTIEVFVGNHSDASPYHAGEREKLNSGLYCETVIKERDKLLVPNALADPDWDKNPDIKLGMISYLGFPVYWPDDVAFGTICVLDNKENAYNTLHIELLETLQQALESDLQQLYRLAQLEKAIDQINALHEILPICSVCKKVKNDKNYWEQVEDYLLKNKGLRFTHSLCSDCSIKYIEEIKQDLKRS